MQEFTKIFAPTFMDTQFIYGSRRTGKKLWLTACEAGAGCWPHLC